MENQQLIMIIKNDNLSMNTWCYKLNDNQQKVIIHDEIVKKCSHFYIITSKIIK